MIYKETIIAKDGSTVPVFNSGKTMHSKYNPVREASSFADGICNERFAIILGLGGGFHIKAFLEKNPGAKIIVVEKSKEDADFLLEHIPELSSFIEQNKITICFSENIEQVILNEYLPAFDGAINILPHRIWKDEITEGYDNIIFKIKNALSLVKADFSVQAHFGKLWQKNIFSNLKLIEKSRLNFNKAERYSDSIKIDTSKTAAIIGAGPSIDRKISWLKEKRSSLYIIATDTAYRILVKSGIIPDAAVTIDSQPVSSTHFIGKKPCGTLFIFDLASNASTVKAVIESGNDVLFSSSSHPLSLLAAGFCKKPFLNLDAGSGTVTISAADFALKCGFKNIMIFGADFAYSNGKPYSKGTYLDELYRMDENIILAAEKKFSALLFRTETVPLPGSAFTTAVLKSYKASLEQWFKKNHVDFTLNDFVYECKSNSPCASYEPTLDNEFDGEAFKNAISQNIKLPPEKLKITRDNPYIQIALPYIAYLIEKNPEIQKDLTTLVQLAYTKILRYNTRI